MFPHQQTMSPYQQATRRPQVRTRRLRTYIYMRGISVPIYTREINTFMFFNTKRKKNSPNYLFLQSRERTFALLLVPREKKFEKSFIL